MITLPCTYFFYNVMKNDIDRFYDVHRIYYADALSEIKIREKAVPLDVVYFSAIKNLGKKLQGNLFRHGKCRRSKSFL